MLRQQLLVNTSRLGYFVVGTCNFIGKVVQELPSIDGRSQVALAHTTRQRLTMRKASWCSTLTMHSPCGGTVGPDFERSFRS